MSRSSLNVDSECECRGRKLSVNVIFTCRHWMLNLSSEFERRLQMSSQNVGFEFCTECWAHMSNPNVDVECWFRMWSTNVDFDCRVRISSPNANSERTLRMSAQMPHRMSGSNIDFECWVQISSLNIRLKVHPACRLRILNPNDGTNWRFQMSSLNVDSKCQVQVSSVNVDLKCSIWMSSPNAAPNIESKCRLRL